MFEQEDIWQEGSITYCVVSGLVYGTFLWFSYKEFFFFISPEKE